MQTSTQLQSDQKTAADKRPIPHWRRWSETSEYFYKEPMPIFIRTKRHFESPILWYQLLILSNFSHLFHEKLKNWDKLNGMFYLT